MYNNYVLGDAEYVDTTTVDGFEMHSFGGFPVLISSEGSVAVVELYRASDDEMEAVDYLESYPSFYNRKEVVLLNGCTAWVYFIDDAEIHTLPYVASNLQGEYDWVLHVQEAA